MEWKPKKVKNICAAHEEGKLDPNKRNQILALLAAEGDKRVESFLFERIFTQIVINCCEENNVSLGWWFQPGEQEQPHYWFKLNAPDVKWNLADEHVANFLSRNNCVVVKIDFNHSVKTFYANQFTNNQWSHEQPLNDVLKRVLNRKAPERKAREYDEIDYRRQRIAIEAINDRFGDAELYYVSLSRILVNCYLYPWFGRQPMDVDACCLLNDRLQFIEFKRKFPTKKGEFGIDQNPHILLIKWLEDIGAPLLHVVLCDPLWNKCSSAVHLLSNNSSTISYALWLGAVLVSNNLSRNTYQTSGRDSGMTGSNREQQGIKLNAFHLLGAGIAPKDLCTFIRNPSTLPRVNISTLRSAHEAAVKSFYASPEWRDY